MQRTTYGVETPEHNMKMLLGKFTTNSTSAPDGIEGQLSTVTRTGVGAFTVVLKTPAQCPQNYFVVPHVVSSAGTRAHIVSVVSSGGFITGVTMELRNTPAPLGAAYTTAVVVASDTATLAEAGYVTMVESTAGTTTGALTIQSTATPATTFCQVTYTAGVATINTNVATDAVTEITVMVIPDPEAVEDTNNEDVYLLMVPRNSAVTTR